MHTTISLQSWLDHLRLLNPVTGVVHVGAGTGQDAARYAHWNVPSAVLIEAEESCHDKLTAVVYGLPGWSVHTALLSDQQEKKDFYLASNPNESGILQPECLTSLWRNLKTKEQRWLNATTLDSLLTELNPHSETINWVVIDCLPALPVLRGACQRLDEWDVILARVVLDYAQLQTSGASKAEVDALLSEHGYRCIACEEERQPAVGRALYVRDWKTSLHARLHNLQQDAAVQAEARTQLQKSLAEQIPLLAERQQQVAELAKISEEQARLAADRLVQINELNKQKLDQEKLVFQRKTAIGELQTELRQKDTRLASLQKSIVELEARERLLNEELLKAEGQIELIKDVLLRETGP